MLMRSKTSSFQISISAHVSKQLDATNRSCAFDPFKNKKAMLWEDKQNKALEI